MRTYVSTLISERVDNLATFGRLQDPVGYHAYAFQGALGTGGDGSGQKVRDMSGRCMVIQLTLYVHHFPPALVHEFTC